MLAILTSLIILREMQIHELKFLKKTLKRYF